MRNKSNDHGIIGTLHVRNAILTNACINTDCVWNTCHWKGLYENGCYKLANNDQCISGETPGFMTIEEAKRKHLI